MGRAPHTRKTSSLPGACPSRAAEPAKALSVETVAVWPDRRGPCGLPTSTWHVIPVGAHWHLLGDSHAHMHVAPAVEGPEHLVIGVRVHADQGDPGRLEAQEKEWWGALFSNRTRSRGRENRGQ